MATQTKKKEELLMSDIGLQMKETIDRVKAMKGHKAAKDKLREMEDSLSMVKQAYFHGVKIAEDIVSGNEDKDSTEVEGSKSKSKADKVINKLRVGWSETDGCSRRDRMVDKLHSGSEDVTGMAHTNSHSPDLQSFDTAEEEANFDL